MYFPLTLSRILLLLIGTAALAPDTASAAPHHTKKHSSSELPAVPNGAGYEWIQVAPFGLSRLYRPASGAPEHLLMFFTGDGGYSPTMNHIEAMISAHGYALLSIDVVQYLKHLRSTAGRCDYPAGDIENLAKTVERRLGFREYQQPLLIGYSSGATLVYAALSEAPHSFPGAISLGFCPDLDLSKPFCKGHGLEYDTAKHGVVFRADKTLSTPWHVFLGDGDKVCEPEAMRAYSALVPGAQFTLLEKVGHGYSVWDRWRVPFMNAVRSFFPQPVAASHQSPDVSPGATGSPQLPPSETQVAPASPALFERAGDPAALQTLPLIEVLPQPAAVESHDAADLFAVVISGDGGWASIDRDIAEELASKGVPVVGLDSLKYFWTKRTPEEAAGALDRILDSYSTQWRRPRALVIGYSFGADVTPFLIQRLPSKTLALVSDTFLLGLDGEAEFEFHFADWVGSSSAHSLPTKPAILAVHGPKQHCFYGSEDREDLCRTLPHSVVDSVALSGGHHFGGNYREIADRILALASPLSPVNREPGRN